MDAMFFHRTLDLVILKTGNPILLCFTYNSNDKYAGLSLYVDCVARLRIAESTTWLIYWVTIIYYRARVQYAVGSELFWKIPPVVKKTQTQNWKTSHLAHK